jgi:hypothetical protein
VSDKPTGKSRRIIGPADSIKKVKEELPFEVEDIWIWNGDLDHALAYPDAEPEKWLVEKGILTTEDDRVYGVKDLLVGDVIYRVRKMRALDKRAEPAESFFDWFLVNSVTGVVIAPAGIKVSPQTNYIVTGS